MWYDQFTSTDWVHDSIADAYRAKALRNRKDFWGRVYLLFDGAQGWILSALVGFLIAVLAYIVNVTESTAFDFKDGYCARRWYFNEKVNCCASLGSLFTKSQACSRSHRNAALMGPARTGEIGPKSFKATLLASTGPNTLYTSAV